MTTYKTAGRLLLSVGGTYRLRRGPTMEWRCAQKDPSTGRQADRQAGCVCKVSSVGTRMRPHVVFSLTMTMICCLHLCFLCVVGNVVFVDLNVNHTYQAAETLLLTCPETLVRHIQSKQRSREILARQQDSQTPRSQANGTSKQASIHPSTQTDRQGKASQPAIHTRAHEGRNVLCSTAQYNTIQYSTTRHTTPFTSHTYTPDRRHPPNASRAAAWLVRCMVWRGVAYGRVGVCLYG